MAVSSTGCFEIRSPVRGNETTIYFNLRSRKSCSSRAQTRVIGKANLVSLYHLLWERLLVGP